MPITIGVVSFTPFFNISILLLNESALVYRHVNAGPFRSLARLVDAEMLLAIIMVSILLCGFTFALVCLSVAVDSPVVVILFV